MRIWSKFAGVTATAGAALILSAFGVLPTLADNEHGDMWTQPAGTPEETSGHSQEVHLPCGEVDLWGDKLAHETGNWVLYHQPPPNEPHADRQLATGPYSYSGEGSQRIATIHMADLMKNSGPHFKVELANDQSKFKTFWLDCKASIQTNPDPSSATVGATLNDTATLSGAFSPTGSILFQLYAPGGALAYSKTVAVDGNGVYSTAPGGFAANAAGTWQWKASYSGDGGNDPVSSALGEEPVTVGKADPGLTTTQDPTGGVIGVTLQDSAQLNHGYNPTGTITFHLLNPSGTDVHHETVTVDGNGSYPTSHGFVANTAGTWQWWAEYSGDSNNNAKHTQVGAEPVAIASEPVTPTIRTTQVPATAVVGDVLKDTATLGGTVDATGHITFELFDPNGHSAYHVTVDVTKYHTEYTTPDGFIAYGPGTWYWVASYSGDENNNGVTSGTHEEPVTVEKATPTITTSQDPDSGFVGTTMQDSATLTGYHPTGTITFFLNNPSGVNVYHETVDVTAGSATYSTTHGFAADAVGIWHWWAEYNGDANNNKVHSLATDEPVIIREQGSEPVTPTIKTTPIPKSAAIHARLKDSATLAGGDDPTGTIVFTLLRPNGVAAYTETVTVSGNGTYTTPTGFLTDVGGTWHWKAAYSGDLKNNPVVSDPADEPVVVAIGGVLAETAMTTPLQAGALAIFAFGLVAMMAGGALALRRRVA